MMADTQSVHPVRIRGGRYVIVIIVYGTGTTGLRREATHHQVDTIQIGQQVRMLLNGSRNGGSGSCLLLAAGSGVMLCGNGDCCSSSGSIDGGCRRRTVHRRGRRGRGDRRGRHGRIGGRDGGDGNSDVQVISGILAVAADGAVYQCGGHTDGALVARHDDDDGQSLGMKHVKFELNERSMRWVCLVAILCFSAR